MKTFTFNKKNLSYTDSGGGFPLVLLHGYLETKAVWNNFAEQLAVKHRVIIPDIPGHGHSELLAPVHSMELMADAINALLEHLKIDSCLMLGHSMGAYVMLAFAEKYPEKLAGMLVFHSSVYADTDEKKQNRLNEISLIEKGQLRQVIEQHLPRTFARPELPVHQANIEQLIHKALQHHPQGVCALIRGMMERPDRQALIKKWNKPLAFIFGANDSFIPQAAALQMQTLNPRSQVYWLKHSGHMGFIEEPEASLKLVLSFAESLG
ncbi:MAG: alpha/beta fold hydrolase [Salinivirgaceae bacterium]